MALSSLYRTFFSVNLRVVDIEDLPVEGQIRRIFKEDADIAIAIASAESGLRCEAVSQYNSNGTRDWGLFQLNDAYHKPELNCLKNIREARAKQLAWGNWEAWSVYNNKRYERYLK